MRMLRVNILNFILLSCALFLAAPMSAQAACNLPDKRPIQTKAEFSPRMDTQLFVDSVTDALGESFMGYVMILQGTTGKIIAEINQGYARNPCERAGAQPFTRNTTVDWGSITKMVTAAAAIDQAERSPRQSLDDKMADYLPHRWKIGEGWKAVTIRHLLSYQGGFNHGKGSLRQRVARPETERAVGSYKYENANFTAFQYMGAYFGGPNWNNVENGYDPGDAAQNDYAASNESAYDDYIWTKTRALWKQVLRARIFNPLGVRGDCDKIDFNGDNYALYYKTPDSQKGYFINPLDQKNCTSGGMVMSPKDMGVFLYALTHTDKIISHENYQSLMTVTTNDLVAWNNNEPLSDGQAFWKDGAWNPSGSSIPGNTASGEVHNYIIAFPNGMSVVFVSNSDKVGGDPERGPRRILFDAYEAAIAASQ